MNKIKLQPRYPVYPPYHRGEYLEDYFMTFFDDTKIVTDRTFIPVSWTTYYCDGYSRQDLQRALNDLDRDGKYFTVCQHDDAVQENLPEDTLIFSAGGNCEKPGVIPIPLVCSEIPSEFLREEDRDTLISFVGSDTHPIRKECLRHLLEKEGVELYYKPWANTVPIDQFDFFVGKTLRSKFCLAPRGYGKSSFRMYEAMRLGSIPVYVSDEHYTPFSDVIDWSEFSVLISVSQIPKMYDILLSYTDEDISRMQCRMKEVYRDYFTMDSVCLNIKRILEDEN
tara:strand:- start:8883 stop:9725 length:843 start_codon:yes stop_codon:yes gene_type:complete